MRFIASSMLHAEQQFHSFTTKDSRGLENLEEKSGHSGDVLENVRPRQKYTKVPNMTRDAQFQNLLSVSVVVFLSNMVD